MSSFKIQGQLCHKRRNLPSVANRKPIYAQLYFADTENKMRNRFSFRRADNDLNENSLRDLQRALYMYNLYVKSFNQANDIIKEYSAKTKCPTGDVITSHGKRFIPAGLHERIYDLRTAPEACCDHCGK